MTPPDSPQATDRGNQGDALQARATAIAGNWRISAGDEHQVFDERECPLVSVPCGGLSGRTFAEAATAARLIAAAPDLLEALAEAVEEIEELRRYANNHGGMIDSEACDYGRAALAKARAQ